MATTDFYRDEKPKPGESGGSTGGYWGTGGGGSGSGGGSWGSGGGGSDGGSDGSGGGSGGGSGAEKPWYLIGYWDDEGEDLIVVNAENVIMSDGTCSSFAF